MVDAILGRRYICKLQELNLQRNYIDSAGGRRLSEGLIAHSPRLRSLNLFANPIGDATAEFLGKALQNAQSLGELDVRYCKLSSRGLALLLGALSLLSSRSALRVLRIGINALDGFGASSIAKFLLSSSGRRLTELDISNSNITEAAALELSAVFAKAYTLKFLDIRENPLGPRGAVVIVDALAAATSTVPMDMIDLSRCNIGDDGAAAVGRLIARRGCRDLQLSNNEMHAAGAKAIADSVVVSACMIETLELFDNPIGDEGVTYLLDKIIQSRPRKQLVQTLGIVEIGMGVGGAMALKRAVEANGAIRDLHVCRNSGDAKADGILREVELNSKSSKGTKLHF